MPRLPVALVRIEFFWYDVNRQVVEVGLPVTRLATVTQVHREAAWPLTPPVWRGLAPSEAEAIPARDLAECPSKLPTSAGDFIEPARSGALNDAPLTRRSPHPAWRSAGKACANHNPQSSGARLLYSEPWFV